LAGVAFAAFASVVWAEGEQMDDVSRGQRWIGAVLRAQLIDRTLKTETDVVLLNRSGEGEIGDRLGHRGIYELDRAAGENETVSVED
jgi:hypothetical protein